MIKEDVVIIGSGIAGLTAGIYLARAGYKPLIISGASKGGQTAQSDLIENYPGFEDPIAGFDLIDRTEKQAKKVGVISKAGSVKSVDFTNENNKILTLDNGEAIQAKAVIIATGCSSRKLGIEAEQKYLGKGIGYCAICDGFFYRGKEVFIVGGGNTAIYESLYLSKICKKVTLVHRSESFKAEKVLLDELKSRENVEFITNAQVQEVLGDDNGVNKIQIKHNDGKTETFDTDGLFVAIGKVPNSAFIKDVIDTDNAGFIKVNHPHTSTNVKGVFACGDIAHPVHQIVVAAGMAAVSAIEAQEFLQSE